MRTDVLTYAADGLAMRSDLYVDDRISGPRPGVLVFPEAYGLGEHARTRAERLAGIGYAALACDLHGGGETLTDLDRVLGLLAPLRQDPPRIRARAEGGLRALLGRPEVDAARIAAIGFCFGGTMAFELARGGAAIAGAVGFHSGLLTAAPQDARNIKGRILACLGADDPSIDIDQRKAFEEEMRAGGVDWQMNLYGGVIHSFTNPAADTFGRPDFARYDAKADARSWGEMRAFFDDIFA